MNRIWKWLLLAGLIVWLGYRLWPVPAPSYPPTYEIPNFPIIAQPDNVTCGPTSITMVLAYYGVNATVDEIATSAKARWYTKKDGSVIGGTTIEYMGVAFSKFKMKSVTKRGASLDELKSYVSQGIPVIANVRSGAMMWHFVVVVGYDDNNVIIADPGWGERRVIPINHFMGAWEFTQNLEGEDETIRCPVCKGTGSWCYWLGPLAKCDVCAGTGKLPNIMEFLLEMGEAQRRTIIVPLI